MIKVNKSKSSKNRSGMKKLRYIDNNGVKDKKGNYYESNKAEVWYDQYFIKIYPSTVGILMSINRCPVYLFLYLTTIATDDNWVTTGSGVMKRFNDWLKILTDGESSYADSTIKNAFMKLREVKLLVGEDSGKNRRGSAKINPLHFWKGDERSRVKAIQKMMDDGVNARNKKLEEALQSQWDFLNEDD